MKRSRVMQFRRDVICETWSQRVFRGRGLRDHPFSVHVFEKRLETYPGSYALKWGPPLGMDSWGSLLPGQYELLLLRLHAVSMLTDTSLHRPPGGTLHRKIHVNVTRAVFLSRDCSRIVETVMSSVARNLYRYS